MKVLLTGNMARDAAVAERLVQEDCELHIASSIHNPSLISSVSRSGGSFYSIDNVSNPYEIAEVAVTSGADLFLTNSDDALANGVVDEVIKKRPDMLVTSPDRKSARIEWDKLEAREIIQEIDEDRGTAYNPRYVRVDEFAELLPALSQFRDEGMLIAVKPRNLTGGKGVKVMDLHLEDYTAVNRYAIEILEDPFQSGLLLEEKLEGHEFTIQGITDGKTLIAPPVTYDYPQREDGDSGPGTGGMGSFTMPPGEQLPFLDDGDYLEALQLMRGVLFKQRERGNDIKGVLYGSFFKTREGLKVVEFNARMGDPEGLNIVELLAEERPLISVLRSIAEGNLSEDRIRFKRLASTALYLVSPDYAYGANEETYQFELDPQQVAAAGCHYYFGAAEASGLRMNRWKTAGSSRTVALTACAQTPWEARSKIHEAIHSAVRGPLQYRNDVADHDYIRIDLNR